jgi:L,D-transpeptidase ErfK/SrfK
MYSRLSRYPVGEFRVIEKIEKPLGRAGVAQKRTTGIAPLSAARPDNPLGSHALRLSLRTILIHGTHRPWSICSLLFV